MEAKMMLWTLMAACLLWSGSSRSTSHFSSFLQNKVYEESVAYRITGPNGHCADVKDNRYNDGNPIILWPCQSNSAVNQLWTFLSDGTIRSNGKCLTTYGYSQSNYIMIYDCNTAAKDATIWELRDDGEILNPRSGLVLTAIPGTVGTELTVEVNVSSSLQTWRVGNNTQPSVVTIVGYANLCLQAIEKDVWVATCEENKAEQRWLLYSDGTIRPEQNRDGCLSYDNLIDAKVLVLSCGLGPSSQRWLFNTDSDTILNPRTGLVLDVRQSNPNLKDIIVYPPTGNANQRWEVLQLAE